MQATQDGTPLLVDDLAPEVLGNGAVDPQSFVAEALRLAQKAAEATLAGPPDGGRLRFLVRAVDAVAKRLGNTPAVCRRASPFGWTTG